VQVAAVAVAVVTLAGYLVTAVISAAVVAVQILMELSAPAAAASYT
jgi:hypothetical protein